MNSTTGVNALIFTGATRKAFAFSRTVGAYRIASEIRKAGYTCQVIDFFSFFNEADLNTITNAFVGSSTLIVGFSTTFFESEGVSQQTPHGQLMNQSFPFSNDRMVRWFNEMRAINPNIKILMGGTKTQYLSGPVDAFAVGYSDKAVVEYMKYLEGKNPLFQFERLNDHQLYFYGKSSERTFIFNQSSIDWHASDHLLHQETVPIEISRGCKFMCKFCNFPGNGKMSSEYIKTEQTLRNELLRNYHEYGITRYLYSDDTHNDSTEKIELMHRVSMSLPFELEYSAYLRIDLLYTHKYTAKLLRESGLRGAALGIETFNHAAGKAIGKGLHPEKNKETLYFLKELWGEEVVISSGFIVGLPHDSQETIAEWSKWITDKDCPLDSTIFTPLFINGPHHTSPGRINKSQFEIDATKYGYTFPTGNYEWKNEFFTYREALDFALKLNAQRSLQNTVHAFETVLNANLGLPPGPGTRVRAADISERKDVYVNGYIDRVMNQVNQLR